MCIPPCAPLARMLTVSVENGEVKPGRGPVGDVDPAAGAVELDVAQASETVELVQAAAATVYATCDRRG